MAAPDKTAQTGKPKVYDKTETKPAQPAHEKKSPGYQTYGEAMTMGGKSFSV